MQAVRQIEPVKQDQPKKRRPKGKVNRAAVLQSRIQLVQRQVYTKEVLRRLMTELPAKDQATFLCYFNKPPQLPAVKDDTDKLTPEQVDQLFERIQKQAQ